MIDKINIRGLKEILRKFDEDGYHVQATHWSIGRGGYDLQWELYYDGIPVVDCIADEISNICLPDKVFNRIAKIILQEYNTNPYKPMFICR